MRLFLIFIISVNLIACSLNEQQVKVTPELNQSTRFNWVYSTRYTQNNE
jgi:hypothetical protein